MRIYPLRTGTVRCNKSVVTQGRGYDEWIDVPATAWFIDAYHSKLLVDTGMCDTARADTYHYPGSTQEPHERIDNALRSIGVDVGDIDTVVMTHLHWDHCYNISLFKHARILVQRSEYRYALDPHPPYYASYEAEQLGLVAPFRSVDLEQIDGDCEIAEGVTAIQTPGHSPGHQSVIVDCGSVRYGIAGDALMSYDNMEPSRLRATQFTMIGRYMDVVNAWNSMSRIVDACDHVLPSHDMRVYDKEVYF